MQHKGNARSSAPRGLGVLFLLAASLASCRSATRATLPPEWFEVSWGGVDRTQEDDDPVEDALWWGLGGGYDFKQGSPVRAGFEIGAAYSNHEVDVVLPDDSDPDLDVWRMSLGARMQTDLGEALTLDLRGGGLWRIEDGDAVPGTGEDQFGVYAGVGLDWWFDPDGSVGPFVLYTRGLDDDLEEWAFGLAARFYFDSSAWDWDFDD